MPAPEGVVAIVREWVAKAEDDLTNASHTLKLGVECPTWTVCFHAQQCVEKYLKAVLVLQCIAFPKTHEIEELMRLIPSSMRPSLSDEEQERMTHYAVVTRYPGWPEIELAEARHAVTIAQRVRREVRKQLPMAALRKQKRK